MTDFDRAHEFSARWEGGYVWNKRDPGGETNLGVTRSNWESWCRQKGLPFRGMRALTPADVRPFYLERYWNKLAASLPWPLSAAIYDMSVNHGTGDGDPTDEGGAEEGATWMLWYARRACPNGTPLEQALAACAAREAYYRNIVRHRPASREFLAGWLNRVNAQRAWLKVNAQPPGPPRVLLVPLGGGEPVEWDGTQGTVYGGVPLTDALVAQLRLVYPCPSGPWTYQGLRGWHQSDGDLVLERA